MDLMGYLESKGFPHHMGCLLNPANMDFHIYRMDYSHCLGHKGCLTIFLDSCHWNRVALEHPWRRDL